MKILHICAGWQHWNGAANIARMIMDEQRREGHEVSFAAWAKVRDLRAADEVWIHCGWLPCLWWAAFWAKNARWMPEACYDPVRLKFSAWKKRLVGPIERWSLRRCKKLVATCDAEKAWIEAYLGKKCPEIVVEDVKRFFKLGVRVSAPCGCSQPIGTRASRATARPSQEIGDRCLTHKKLNVLYLGRRHPLKGVEFLEAAVAELNAGSRSRESSSRPLRVGATCGAATKPSDREAELDSGIGNFSYEENLSIHCSTSTSNFDYRQIELKIVSDAFGEEKEKVWDWCDVLVLPTLSENFGLVVAEALERGKRVITTDGAPAWGEGSDGVREWVSGGVECRYGGRLLYLKGYRDGSEEERVELLKMAIEILGGAY